MTLKRTIPVLATILLAALTPSPVLSETAEPTPDVLPDAGAAPATGTSPESAPDDTAADDALEDLRNAKASAGIEARRNRKASFEVRFGGHFMLGNRFETYVHPIYESDGLSYVRDAANTGQFQIGVGGGWLFDFRVSLTIPTWTVLAEFEFNLVRKGRLVPTVGAGIGYGIYAGVLLKLDVGMEFWILDWLAAYVTVGMGLEIQPYYGACTSCEHDGIGGTLLVAPVSFGLEMRY